MERRAPAAARRVEGGESLAALRQPAQPEGIESRLRRYIVEGGLGPGDRLPSEVELAAASGSSRLMVREGLRSLEALGVLEARVGSGWYVRRFDVYTAARAVARSLAFHPAALLDLLAVRRATEADLVEEVAGTLGERDLDGLEELVDRMRWRASRGRSFIEEDRAFHGRLFAAGGNLVALALADLYFEVVEALFERGLPGPAVSDLPAVAESHAAILAALRAGDGRAARRLLRSSHHEEARRRFAAQLGAASPVGEPPAGGDVDVHAVIQGALLGHVAATDREPRSAGSA